MPQVDVVTNLFGGSLPGEGMGFLAISLDWVFVGSHGPMFVPLAAQVSAIPNLRREALNIIDKKLRIRLSDNPVDGVHHKHFFVHASISKEVVW